MITFGKSRKILQACCSPTSSWIRGPVAAMVGGLTVCGLMPAAKGQVFLKNGDFEAASWNTGWSPIGSPGAVQETATPIAGAASVRIPVISPAGAPTATAGIIQELVDPGTGRPRPMSDFVLEFDFRQMGTGGGDRSFTFGLHNGTSGVIVLMIQNGIFHAFGSPTWRPLHATSVIDFNDAGKTYHVVLRCHGLGSPGAKYDLEVTDGEGGGFTASNLTHFQNNYQVGSVVLNNAYTGQDYLVDNISLRLPAGAGGYNAWISSTPGVGDPRHSADADGDGTGNLLEYVLGSAPGETDQTPMQSTPGANPTFLFSRREPSSIDTVQVFEYSSDLAHWTQARLTAPADASVAFDPPIGEMQQVTITLPADADAGGRLFGRLKAAPASPAQDGVLAVHTDFEGGSAHVMSINQSSRTIRVRPAGDPARGWPCWWYLRVSGLNIGETLTLQVDASHMTEPDGAKLPAYWALPDRAATSGDHETWIQTAPGVITSTGTWQVTATAKTMWFAWGPPFTPSDAAALVRETAQSSSHAEAFELCKSNEGRPVPALRITQDEKFDDPARRYIWIHARAHAWESGASWTCKGLVDWLAGDDPRAESLRSMAIVHVVPILDIDNTFHGNGGKEGLPHDHNRDWSGNPVFAEVRAAQQLVGGFHASGRLSLFLELHNPGPDDLRPIYYIPPSSLLSAEGAANLTNFMAAGTADLTGPLVLSETQVVMNSGYHPLWQSISINWASALPGDAFGACLEVPWNTVHSTPGGYMQVGAQQGLAIERYLRTAW